MDTRRPEPEGAVDHLIACNDHLLDARMKLEQGLMDVAILMLIHALDDLAQYIISKEEASYE